MVGRYLGISCRSALVALVAFALRAGVVVADGPVTVTINQVDTSRFPNLVAYVTVLNERGYPQLGLGADSFQLTEEGKPVQGLTVATALDLQQSVAAVLAIDVSGSMSPQALAQEKAAAIQFINGLRPQDSASVVAFSTSVQRLTGFTTDRAALVEAVQGLSAGGNTALYDALWEAVYATEQAPAARRIVVLETDGYDTSSRASLDDGLKLAARDGVAIHTIGLGEEIDREVLSRIARQTGGTGLVAPSPDDLLQAYSTIGAGLRGQYALSWASPEPRGARSYRLALEVRAPAGRARTETAYQSAPNAPAITRFSLHDGVTLTGPAIVSLDVAAPLPVTSVQLAVNGRTMAETSSAPYELPLDPRGLGAGRQEVTVRVTDVAGSEATARAYVVVAGEEQKNRGTGDQRADAAGAPVYVGAEAGGFLLPQGEGEDEGRSAGERTAFAEALDGAAPTGSRSGPLPEGEGMHLPAFSIPWPDFGSAAAAMQALAEAQGHRVPPAAAVLAASLIGFVQARRLKAALLGALRTVQCPDCGSAYRAYREFCENCLEREARRERTERSLGEVLLQNGLLGAEALEAAMEAARTENASLETVVVEKGFVDAAGLTRARYYLERSLEMQERLRTVARERALRPRLPVRAGTVLRYGLPAAMVLLVWGLALPQILG